MKAFRKFLIFYIVSTIFVIPACIAIDFFYNQSDANVITMMKTFNKIPVDVLYFGDSTLRFHGDRDTSSLGIDQIFQTLTHLKVCTVAHPGYSAILYSQYIELLDKAKFKPKIIVVPINLRSFTGSTIMRPALNFPLRQFYIKYKNNGNINILNYIQYRFLGLEDKLTDEWKNTPIVYDGISLGTPAKIQSDSYIHENLDYYPEREKYYKNELAIKFRFHYMAPVTTSDFMFNYLNDMINYTKNKNIKILFYITPINYQDGIKYAGEGFIKRNNETIRVISKFMSDHGVVCLNIAHGLGPEYFIDKSEVYEHLNFKGRRFVAEQVAHVATQFFK